VSGALLLAAIACILAARPDSAVAAGDSRPSAFHAAIENADRIVVRDGGFDCCRPVDADPIIFQETDPNRIREVYRRLQFASTNGSFGCMCCGYPGIDW
jgi:hypothetical protein